MISPTLFALTALAMTPQGAHAFVEADEGDAGDGGFIMNAWSNPETCHQHVAQPVALTSVTQDPEKLLGECVMIEGFWHGRAMFDKAEFARVRYSQSSDKLSAIVSDYMRVGTRSVICLTPRRARALSAY